MFNIMDLSNEENRLIASAKNEYQDFFTVANRSVELLWNFSYKYKLEKWMSFGFLSQVQKNMQLVLFSFLRQHTVQANMMLRYVSESFALTMYSMYEKKEDAFYKIKEDGTVQHNDKALGKAYSWLEKEQPDYDKRLRYLKAQTNNNLTHGNILPSVLNTDHSDDNETRVLFFDNEASDYTKLHLCWVSDACLDFLRTLSILNEQYPTYYFVNDFDETMRELGIGTNKIRDDMKQTVTFKKFF